MTEKRLYVIYAPTRHSQPVIAPSEALDTVLAYLWKTPLV
jgi:hypothetical protein